jgi:hypothetical protein
MKKNFDFVLKASLFFLFIMPAIADYSGCKRVCAERYQNCINRESSTSPEACAERANSCLYDCQESSAGGSSGSVTRDLSSCRTIVESAVDAAMRAGKSDSEIMQAGSSAQDRCMQGKGY